MKKEKLELKDLAPYLPYGLKWKYSPTVYGYEYITESINIDGEVLFKEWEILKDDKIHIGYEGFNLSDEKQQFKPILRPLSDLTKKITIDGKTFVPSQFLNDLILLESDWYTEVNGYFSIIGITVETQNGEQKQPVFMNGEICDECHYGIYKFLIEWHFDVFGLIDSNLAVDINNSEK